MRVDSILTIKKGELSKREMRKLLTKLTFIDADENEVMAYDYVTGRQELRVPRGAWDMLPRKVKVNDLRSCPPMPKIALTTTLDAPGYDGQLDSLRAMFEHEQGQVIAPPGRGKTEISLAFAAMCKTRTLVIVHTQDLFKQWVDRTAKVAPGMSVGQVVGKQCEIGHVTIAMAPTLRRYILSGGKFWRQFGCVIVDEAHHAAAETWEWVLNTCPARYRFGVTASEKRSDGRQALVRFNIGPVIYRMGFRSQVPIVVRPVETKFLTQYSGSQYTRIMRQIVNSDDRNMIIAKLVAQEIENDRRVLVLSRQIKHLENIRDSLWLHWQGDEGWLQYVEIVTGRLARRKRDDLIEGLRTGRIWCILGTQLFEEGVDIPALDCIILAYPGTDITVLQKVGRGTRQSKGKEDTLVYDLVDDFVPALARQYLQRRRWYRRQADITVSRVVRLDKATPRRK